MSPRNGNFEICWRTVSRNNPAMAKLWPSSNSTTLDARRVVIAGIRKP